MANGGTGTYNLNGGSLSVGYMYLGSGGTATFVQSGGTNSIFGSFHFGYTSGATSSISMAAFF